jgi:O-antigen/teichoic acid export membrane protein
MDQLLIREIPAFQLRHQWNLLRGVVRTANGVVVCASCVLIATATIASLILRRLASPEVLSTFWIALAMVPVTGLTRVRQATLQGLHRVVLGAVPERLVLPGLLLASLEATNLWRGHLTAPMAMTLTVAASVVAFAVGARVLHAWLPAEVRHVAPSYQTRAWVRSGFPIFLLSSVGVLFSQSDILILGSIAGPSAVGPYGIADKTADLLTVVHMAQNAAFASTAASLAASADLATLQRLATRIARFSLLSAIPLAIMFIGFGRWFLAFFYGREFGTAHTALVFLTLGQLVNVGAGLNGMLLVTLRKPGEAVKAFAAGAATNICLNLLLVPRWGMNGSAVANMVSLVVWNSLAAFALRRQTGIRSSVLGSLRSRTFRP